MKKAYILAALLILLSSPFAVKAETIGTECTGEGMVYSIDESYLDDNGSSGYDDRLEFFCRKGIVRLCLSGETCPWKTDIASADDLQCGMSNKISSNDSVYDGNGVKFGGSYDGGLIWFAYIKGWQNISTWKNYNAFACSADGKTKKMIQFDNNGIRLGSASFKPEPSVTYNYNYDYNYDYNYNDDYNSNLYVECYPEERYVETDERVRWTAYVSGGNGSYRYDWSGSEGLRGTSKSVSISYDREGTKNATVYVTSGGRSISRSCGSVTVEDRYRNDYYDDYYYTRPSVYCYPDVSYAETGDRVIWRAYASGGDGRYTYTWSGTDNLSGRNDDVSKTYSRNGTKTASVTVRSDGRSTSASCGSVSISGNYDYYPTYFTPTPVYTGALSASCAPSIANAKINNVITWTAYPTGGNGVYTYAWTGSDGFTGAQKSVVTSYKTTGPKYATVSIYSAGKSITISCGTTNISAASTVSAKKPVVKKPIIKEIEEKMTESDFDAYKNVPWMLVMIIVIVVLFVTVMYLLFSEKK